MLAKNPLTRLAAIIFFYFFVSASSAADESNDIDHLLRITTELSAKGMARIYLSRSDVFVKPSHLNSQKRTLFVDTAQSPGQLKYNIMKIHDGNLTPFAQILPKPKAYKSFRSVYVDVVAGELRLLVQALNVINFGTKQGFVDEISLVVDAGKTYHIAVGLDSFRGVKTYSGIELTTLPTELFNPCFDLKKYTSNKSKLRKSIKPLTNIYSEALGCVALAKNFPQPEIKKGFIKWVDKQQKSLFASLERRRKSDVNKTTNIGTL